MPFEIFWLLVGTPLASLPEPPPRPEEAVEVAAESGQEPSAEEPEILFPDDQADLPLGRERLGPMARFSYGPTYLWGRYTGKLDASDAVSRRGPIDGFAASADMVVGGAPVPGFIIGARAGIIAAPAAGYEAADGTTVDLDPLWLLSGGVVADWYLVPDGGFHVFAATGLAILLDPEPLYHDVHSGIAWSAGVGYELWLSERWSAGITLRVDGASLIPDSSESSDGSAFFFLCPAAQMSFTVQ